MIQMTYYQALEPAFREAANAIWHSPNLDAKTSYSAHRVKKALDKVFKEASQIQQDLAKKYAKMTKLPDGKEILHRDPSGRLMFDDDKKAAEFEAEFEKVFREKKLELKVTKLPFAAIQRVQGLAPVYWEHLEPIVEGLPKEEGENNE